MKTKRFFCRRKELILICAFGILIATLQILASLSARHGCERESGVASVVLKRNIIPKTTENSVSTSDYMSKRDSNMRKGYKNNVCKKLRNNPNILHLSSYNKTTQLQRFNVLHHLVVSEKQKVLFCFIPKIACSNMKRIFLVLNGLYPSIAKVKGDFLNREILRLDNKRFSNEDVKYMLKTYYKFMIVRDPFGRLVSAYTNKWLGKENVQLHSTLGKLIVRRYRFNDTLGRRGDVRGDDVRFTEYARYVIDTPSENLNEHWMPYNDLCRPCDVNYDFIGSINTLSRDVSYAMRQIKVDVNKYYMRPAKEGALVKTKAVTGKYLKTLPEKVFNDLVKKFKLDYELFGYSVPEYKSLGKEV